MEENQQLIAKPGAGSIRERSAVAAGELMARFRGLDPAKKRWLLAGAGMVIACLAGLIWYASRPDWRTLYAGLDPQDAREMASELTAAGIPFDVSTDGTALRVGAEHLDKARLATTAKGGPRSGRMGFELFDKPNWVGSEFDEKVNYQRALEGELEHTIGTLSDIENARVHLVMPHDSLFTDQQRESKASVVLKLRRRTLPEQEADSIRNLVASAVDDLHPENVVLLDAQGRQLGRKGGTAEMEAHEQELAAKLVETLEPIAGTGNVRASVNVEYDTSTADEVDETYDPNDVVTLSMQRSEQTSGGQPVAAGVPGTASNASNLKSVSLELVGIRDEVLSLANSSYLGQYIFAGSQGGTQPFTLNASTTPNTVAYNGDGNVSYVETPAGQKVQLNVPGDEIFTAAGANVLGSLNALIADFSSGAPSATSVADLASLSSALGYVDQQRAVIDNSLNRLTTSANYASGESVQLLQAQDNLIQTDTASVSSQLSMAETQQAALTQVIAALDQQGNLFQRL